MEKTAFAFLMTNLFLLLPINALAQSCDSFRECDDLGRSAKKAGDLSIALAYYQEACFMEAAKPLWNLRNNACLAVTEISGALDYYETAYSLFGNACNEGKDAGCFHLALLEKERGDLKLAMEMMKPLCDKKYIIHENVYSNACTELKQMKSTWKVKNPRQPRDNKIQIPVFVITLLLPIIATVFLFLKKYQVSITLSVLAFICYGYYEYGVSPYANIRIDLLLIWPLLFLNFVVLIASIVILIKRTT